MGVPKLFTERGPTLYDYDSRQNFICGLVVFPE
jgi:hypothetical protein